GSTNLRPNARLADAPRPLALLWTRAGAGAGVGRQDGGGWKWPSEAGGVGPAALEPPPACPGAVGPVLALSQEVASSSLATEWMKGKMVEEALTIKNTDIAKERCLPPLKLHCSMLAEDAIKAAPADYKLKQEPKKKRQRRNEPSLGEASSRLH
uniref:NIF system FeS cluster assembly NifU N-terminal domain-containing protein n=1 Tax=Callithrix jacchus TaxID=9483 RepID=A0A8I3W420_CALJA